MWTDPLLWLTGLGCVGAVLCAAHSPRNGRWEAVALACLLLVNFALFQLAYTEWSPKVALSHIGIETSSVQLWMLTDATGGVAAMMLANRFWWGWALWGVSLIQITFHSLMDAGLVDPVFYTDVLLNLALLIQLSIFFATGGREFGHVLLRGVSRLRLSGSPSRSPSSQRSRW